MAEVALAVVLQQCLLFHMEQRIERGVVGALKFTYAKDGSVR